MKETCKYKGLNLLLAFSRLGAISIGVVITFIVIIFAMRTIGYQNASIEPPHPWYKDQVWIIVPWDCQQPPLEGVIPLLEVKPVSDKSWMVKCLQNSQELTSVLEHYDFKKIMFRIETPEPPAAESLNKYMARIQKPISVGAWAPVSAVGRELRRLRPDWVYALDPAAALQFHTLTQLWLEPLASLWADFWIEDAKLSPSLELKNRARAEVIRRNKKIVILDDNIITDLPQDAKGILTTRPSYWLTRPR